MDAFVPCDSCGMRSYVHVELDTGGTLSWCAHHYREHEEALWAYSLETEFAYMDADGDEVG